MASELKVNTVTEYTTNNGLTVDTFKLKDGAVDVEMLPGSVATFLGK